MSVMDSLCSSRTSDRVILLPLLGTSNTRIAPDETPRERKIWTVEFCPVSWINIFNSVLTHTYVTLPHCRYTSSKHGLSWDTNTSCECTAFDKILLLNTFLSHTNMWLQKRASMNVYKSAGTQSQKYQWVNLTEHRNVVHVYDVLTAIWDYVYIIM